MMTRGPSPLTEPISGMRAVGSCVLLAFGCAPRLAPPQPSATAPKAERPAVSSNAEPSPSEAPEYRVLSSDEFTLVDRYVRDLVPVAARIDDRGLHLASDCTLFAGRPERSVNHGREETYPWMHAVAAQGVRRFVVATEADSRRRALRDELDEWTLESPVLARGDCEGVTHALSAIELVGWVQSSSDGTQQCTEVVAEEGALSDVSSGCFGPIFLDFAPVELAPPGAESVPIVEPMVRIDGGSIDGAVVHPFWLDQVEVGFEAYERFRRFSGTDTPPSRWRGTPFSDGPAETGAARAAEYCAWVGKRLPTRREWRWAAQGRDERRPYPWGDGPPNYERVHAVDAFHSGGMSDDVYDPENPMIFRVREELTEGREIVSTFWRLAADHRGARPLGASRDGLFDMVGNVSEPVVLADGTARYIGGGYSNLLPDHPELQPNGDPDYDADVPKARAKAKELLRTTAAGEPINRLSKSGIRCAADTAPKGAAVQVDIRSIGSLRAWFVLGLRRLGDARGLCGAATFEGKRWTLPTASQLAALGVAAELDAPVWTEGGSKQAAASTAMTICVALK